MKPLTHKFPSMGQLNDLIDSYFLHFQSQAQQDTEKEKREDKTDFPTITGLALHLGFDSRDEFDQYEANGRFASAIKRARLRIEASYEKKLYNGSPTGAIFALKNLGWGDKPEAKQVNKPSTTLKVKIIETGPTPASSEKEVNL